MNVMKIAPTRMRRIVGLFPMLGWCRYSTSPQLGDSISGVDGGSRITGQSRVSKVGKSKEIDATAARRIDCNEIKERHE